MGSLGSIVDVCPAFRFAEPCRARSPRRGRAVRLSLGSVVFAMAFPFGGYALDVRTSEGSVTVASGETLDDTLIAFGESIDIDGTITGDLIAFARYVNVRGSIGGNVVAMAQHVEISGAVAGSVFGFAQTVNADGPIDRNLFGFAASVNLGGDSEVGGNATIFSGEGSVDGNVATDVLMYGESLDLTGRVGRDITFRGSRVSVRSPAQVGGDLTATVGSEDDVEIDSGVTIAGQTTVDVIESEPSEYTAVSSYVGQAIRLAAAFVTGLFLFWLIPPLRSLRLDTARDWAAAGGIGFLAVVATPVAAVIAAVTLVGLPIAVVAMGLWIVGLYVSKILVAYRLGSTLFQSGDTSLSSRALALVAGLVAIFVAVHIPLAGILINICLVFIGLGALLVTVYRFSGGRPSIQEA